MTSISRRRRGGPSVSLESFFWAIETSAILDVRDSIPRVPGASPESTDAVVMESLLALFPTEFFQSTHYLPDGRRREQRSTDEALALLVDGACLEEGPSERAATDAASRAVEADIAKQIRLPAPPALEAGTADAAPSAAQSAALIILGSGFRSAEARTLELASRGRDLLESFECICGASATGTFSATAGLTSPALPRHSRACTDQLYAAARAHTDELRQRRRCLLDQALNWRRARGEGLAVSGYYFERVEDCGRQMRAADTVASVALLLAHNPVLQSLHQVAASAPGPRPAGAQPPPHRSVVSDVGSTQRGVPTAADFPSLSPRKDPLPPRGVASPRGPAGTLRRPKTSSSPSLQSVTEVPWHLVVGDGSSSSGAAAGAAGKGAGAAESVQPSAATRPPKTGACVGAGSAGAGTPALPAMSDPFTLDLHGQHAAEAERIVRDALLRCHSAGVRTLELITGAPDVQASGEGAGTCDSSRWSASGGGVKRGVVKRGVGALLRQLQSDPAGLVDSFHVAGMGGGWMVAVKPRESVRVRK